LALLAINSPTPGARNDFVKLVFISMLSVSFGLLVPDLHAKPQFTRLNISQINRFEFLIW